MESWICFLYHCELFEKREGRVKVCHPFLEVCEYIQKYVFDEINVAPRNSFLLSSVRDPHEVVRIQFNASLHIHVQTAAGRPLALGYYTIRMQFGQKLRVDRKRSVAQMAMLAISTFVDEIRDYTTTQIPTQV